MQSSKSQPLVSVIVPIYNVEQYVEKCVESIIDQTYTNLEIILVNDGATDGSRGRIEKYEKDPRCIIIDKPNGGLSSARNAGIDRATGEYIYFIDSDDYIDNQAVELLLDRTRSKQADFCCYRVVFYSDSTSRIGGRDFQYDVLKDKDVIIEDAFLNKNIKSTVWLKFFSKAFLNRYRLRFQVGIINEDYLFTILCAIHAQAVAFLDKPLYYAYERPGSISRNIKNENLTSYFAISEIIRRELEDNLIFENHKADYYAGYTKQILYTLVSSAFRLGNYAGFQVLYQNLDGNVYKQVSVGRNIRMLGTSYYLLYRLSLHPRGFYWTIKFLKLCGFHMS